MNEQVARRVVLVRAIESADTGHQVLSEDDRKYASRSARELAAWQAADSKAAVTQEHFLEQRSEQILKRLAERTPAFASFQRRGLGLPGFWAALPVLALVAGALLDRIADPHRVDLLSAPLLFIIGWNLLVYLVLLVLALIPGRKGAPAGQGLLRRLSVGKAAMPRKLPGALATGITNFMAEWAVLSEPLTRARLARTVHLAAAAFALGAVLSLYARGMLTQYVAGWESTFLDATQVHTLLSWLFAPVLLLFPQLQGFTLADIESLRFSAGANTSAAGGERWVHLYGATILLLVVLPRLVLAAIAGWRARRLARRFPLELEHPYFRRLADSIGAGTPAVLRVLPYSFTLDEARDRGLWTVAAMALGAQARVLLRPTVPYGEEPQAALGDTPFDDAGVTVTAALFSLAATPEKENHGAFLDVLVKHSKRGVAVLLDESSLTERGAGQAGLEARVAERIALWRQFCSFHGTAATVVNLVDPNKHPIELGAGLALPELR
ncbi:MULTISPECIES: DUF2868 domain-containing protein [unclassified Massilia]|uniref:DUF2868 domain-containing protein n=1 Tax=unclassified Massilia TaxID=2609279 RepID=UPI00178711D5|nr:MULTISPECIES: DUF2868 domain-containing protein [unclassified Massilia]MBD8533372.1 DUF2868 domain-containing protein [Massilia sp. CFBP 13647]MBD8676758.1 DUF2868 domain-containing protein [Massilia sp. CFBP 13721]